MTKELSLKEKTELLDDMKDLTEELAQTVSQISRIVSQIGDEYFRRTTIADLEKAVDTGGWLGREQSLYDWIEEQRREANEDSIFEMTCPKCNAVYEVDNDEIFENGGEFFCLIDQAVCF